MCSGTSLITDYISQVAFFFYLGIGLNVFCVALMLMLVFEPTLASRVLLSMIRMLEKIHILKKERRADQKNRGLDAGLP